MIALKNTGENNLNAADRLKEFLDGIDDYISLKKLKAPANVFNEFQQAEGLSLGNLDNLTQDQCFNYAFMMYQYADHVASEKASQETVVNWCENSLNSILSVEMEDMSHIIAKHEIKVANILRNHDLARKIDEWKNVAQGRLAKLVSREYNIRRKADILMEKGRRK
jgi:hypothetical protein